MTKNRTKTSDFGVSRREGHDSRHFYSSHLYDGFGIDEKQSVIDRSAELKPEIFSKSLKFNKKNIAKLKDESIHLIIVQIPKIDAIFFENFDLWIQKIAKTIKLLKKFLITGGRLVILVDNHVDGSVKESQYYPIHAKITQVLIDEGMIMRGNVILHLSTEPKPPDSLTSTYHIALISCKDVLKRIRKDKQKTFEKTDTITRDQFLSYTKSIWRYEPELMLDSLTNSVQSNEMTDYLHRFVHLFSFQEDNVLYLFPKIDHSFMKFAQTHRNLNLFFEWEEFLG